MMPHTFQDTAGRVWSVSIGTDTVKRVRSLLSVDLMEFVEGTLMGTLMADVVLFVDVLYAICKPEADARGITDEQFGQAMSGEVLQAAEEALAEGLFTFSHPSRREAARTAWEKMKQLRTRACELATVRLRDPRIDRMFEEQLETTGLESPRPTPGNSSGNSPGSSA
jgi:hypothetical protein